MELRQLVTNDIYKMSKILKKMDLKFDVNEKTTQEQMGVQMIQKILENLHRAEKEVNEFMADLIGITSEEFANLPISETIEAFSQFKELENIAAFLKLAAR